MPSGKPYSDRPEAHAYPAFRDGTQACVGVDPEVFFPPRFVSDAVKPARRICNRCPLKEACLAWALETRQEFGIWGAKTPKQRRIILARNGDPR